MVKEWQQATALKNASVSQPWAPLGWSDGVEKDLRERGDMVHCGSMSLAGWSEAAFGDQSTEGKCRLGYVVGPMSSTLKGPRHISQWTSKLTKKVAKSSLGGEVYALRETAGHMLLGKVVYEPFGGMNPGLAGLGDRESLYTHLKTGKRVAEKYLVRHFLSIQQALEGGEVENAFWLPGPGRRGSPPEDPGIGLLQSGALAPPQRRGLEGARGTRGAPEFIAHVHIQGRTGERRGGRRSKIAHVNFLRRGVIPLCFALSPCLRFLYFVVLVWNSDGGNF